MTNSDFIAIFSLIFSILALVFSVFIYFKDQKRNNQDQLFQEKINAYKELLNIAKTTFTKFFDIVDYVQYFEGDKNQWEKKYQKFSGNYYGMAFEFEYCLSKNSFLLQDEIYSKLKELEFSLIHFITSSSNQSKEITFEAYEGIGNRIEEIESLIKTELNINSLNKGLNKRIK